MLASDADANRLGFNPATDIVELVIFTTDEPFLQTLRDAVGNLRRLWPVPSPDQVSDLLLAGQVGILVLDVNALSEPSGAFIAQIKHQFPDLVLMVAGSREAEASLANLISAGIVYRFIHKPLSPGRAKLFVDAAVRKFAEQGHSSARAAPAPNSRATPRLLARAALAACVLLAAALAIAIALRHRGPTAAAPAAPAAAIDSPLLTRAANALQENRLAGTDGEQALDLYLQILAQNPADPAAKAGLREVQDRLWAGAENSVLEERFAQAAADIETARKAGVDGDRIALLRKRLAEARQRSKAEPRAKQAANSPQPRAVDEHLKQLLSLAEERIKQGSLIEPKFDSAQFYVQQALTMDPDGNAVQSAKQTLAIAVLAEVRAAVDRREFARAASLIDAARGIAADANVENAEQLLGAARKQSANEAHDQLLRSAEERMRQDQLIEPLSDCAAYYLSTLRAQDPTNPGLATAMQDLGQRLVAHARRAVDGRHTAEARHWLQEAADLGYSSSDAAGLAHELDSADNPLPVANRIVAAQDLTLMRSVVADYPAAAAKAGTTGWVELDFTVIETGDVRAVSVHASSPPGVFDAAAVAALSQWQYKPVLVDGTPIAQHSRIRMRFTLRE